MIIKLCTETSVAERRDDYEREKHVRARAPTSPIVVRKSNVTIIIDVPSVAQICNSSTIVSVPTFFVIGQRRRQLFYPKF
jgi:hypothetical protein